MPPHAAGDPSGEVTRAYDSLAARGEIRSDPSQRHVAGLLDDLIRRLAERQGASKASALGWLLGKRKPNAEPVTGLYLHGGVGRGKTMLMDLFFAAAPTRAKRRVHFNDFMTDVHDRITRHRLAVKEGKAKESKNGSDDPIPPVAEDISREAMLLCFDEFSVTDIADAMVLSRLFSALFAHGVVLVATSNVAPDDLYRDGLNRALFLPFVDLLKRHVAIIPLDGGVDYRLEKLSRLPVYMTPLGAETDRQMDAAWAAATEGRREASQDIALMGRAIHVPRASGRAARFSFAELCDAPLGARDYLAIAQRFDTILIDGIPVLDPTRRNPAKRFILLIDTLYDRHKRLIASAEAPPDQLYAGRPGVTEAFEFQRTASRLIEMQSAGWPPTAETKD